MRALQTRTGSRRCLLVKAAAGGLVLVAAVPARDAGAAPVVDVYRPGLRTRFAYLDFPTVARARPSRAARAVGRLRLRTQDGTDEVVLVRALGRGGTWLKVELPVRPTGAVGWIPRSAVGELRRTSTWLKIDKRRLQATLIDHGRSVLRAPVAIGRASSPTPSGSFYVRDRLVPKRPDTMYGKRAFGLSARSEVLTDWPGGGFVGIHGTNQPERIPGRVSHGCIRMRNVDILKLDALMAVGTPVTIR
jgi:L,D-transpeptidase-like protein